MLVLGVFARRAGGSQCLVERVVAVFVLGWSDGTALPESAWAVGESEEKRVPALLFRA